MRTTLLFLTTFILIGLSAMFLSGQRPNNLGVNNNSLSECPDSPNCVSSSTSSDSHFIEPFTLSKTPATDFQNLKNILQKQLGFTLITADENYIHVECKSRILGFVDDLEFFWDAESNVCHVRSASRLGYSDLGVNRKRVEQLRKLFNTE